MGELSLVGILAIAVVACASPAHADPVDVIKGKCFAVTARPI